MNIATTEPPQTRARTKIVATVGPACHDQQTLADLICRGVDVFRINMAHGNRAEHQRVLDDIRLIAGHLGRPLAVLVDLAGPKIRLGKLTESPLSCRDGETFALVPGDESAQRQELTCNYDALIGELEVGDTLLLADGTVAMHVIEKSADRATLQVSQGGTIRHRQGINLPGVKLGLPAMTDADRDNALWAAEQQVDFVSLSFVRSALELRQLRELLRASGSQASVISKIEKPEALQVLDEIVEASDAVMVARGDLGVETDVARTPVVQKQIIENCRRHRRPVIVATEMLDSMQRRTRPTRAEASDVANAILDGADACMLSGETAIGEHPREAVEMMNRIMLATEEMLRDAPSRRSYRAAPDVHPITSAVVAGAAEIAERLEARLVVIATHSGSTARIKAKQRDFIPTIGVSNDAATLRQMCLCWGITPLPGAPVGDLRRLREYIVGWGRGEGSLTTGDRVVFVSGTDIFGGSHNLVEVYEIEPPAAM